MSGFNQFKAGEMRDLNDFKNPAGAPDYFPHKALCRYLHANQDVTVKVYDQMNNFVTLSLKDGDQYNVIVKKIVTSETVGAADTQFDITNPSGSTFRYTYDSGGTDPSISATTFPVGMEVTISAANFSAGNNGRFTVTASADDYFEVTNANGVVESNKTIGATGSINAHRVVAADYITVIF
jgi:hypothetical protein